MRPPSGRSRHPKINDRETFTGLVENATEMKEISPGGHAESLPNFTTAWKSAKAQADVKERTEALQKQHGERITLLLEDWTSIMVQFKAKFGNDLADDELPGKTCSRHAQAEPLDQVISQAEAEEQDRTKTRAGPGSMVFILTLG